MLVLSRKSGEVIDIDGRIKVTVVSIRGGRVRLGIEAPASVPIARREIAHWSDLSFSDLSFDEAPPDEIPATGVSGAVA